MSGVLGGSWEGGGVLMSEVPLYGMQEVQREPGCAVQRLGVVGRVRPSRIPSLLLSQSAAHPGHLCRQVDRSQVDHSL